jgi:HEAT repeat protein
LVAPLIEALKDGDVPESRSVPNVSMNAAHSLGRIGANARGAIPALIELAKRDQGLPSEPGVRSVALRGLCLLARNDPTAIPVVVPALVEMIRGNDLWLRAEAAGALYVLGPRAKDAVPALIEALQVKDVQDQVVAKRIRSNALHTLSRIGPEAKAAVEELTAIAGNQKLSARERQGAAEALGAVGFAAENAIPTLLDLMQKDEDRMVREAAAKAVEAIRHRKP